MTKFNTKIFNIFTINQVDFLATHYFPTQKNVIATILYFHGGGLIFGDRQDLPNSYLQLFTEAGIAVVAVDYPLAPESSLSVVMETVEKIVAWFVNDFLGGDDGANYFIFGRSAGGYLALWSALFARNLDYKPLGIISLYGYFNLNDASFSFPNPHYLKYPLVDHDGLKSIIDCNKMTVSNDPNRFLIYLAVRQEGNWLGTKDEKRQFSISKNDLKTLPPLFVSAATGDPDVPVRQSRQLANSNPYAFLKLIDANEHDFDRLFEDTIGLEVYEEMVRWIEEILEE